MQHNHLSSVGPLFPHHHHYDVIDNDLGGPPPNGTRNAVHQAVRAHAHNMHELSRQNRALELDNRGSYSFKRVVFISSTNTRNPRVLLV